MLLNYIHIIDNGWRKVLHVQLKSSINAKYIQNLFDRNLIILDSFAK